jgi:lysozyme family protein
MATYTKVIKKILKWEGGFANIPGDTGGATNKGVTLATYRRFFGKEKNCKDLKEITQAEWDLIFKKGFWDRWKADEIENQSIAELLVDWVWTSGVWGIKYPQRVLGVNDDGIVGPKTLAAINDYEDQEELFNKLWNRRKKHFQDIAKGGKEKFLKGWLNRLSDFKYREEE